jgi:hypothetical protein
MVRIGVLNMLAKLAQERTEISVTMVVDGVLVSGMTAASAEWLDWTTRGVSAALSVEFPAETADEIALVQAGNAITAGDTEEFPLIYLKDVTVFAGSSTKSLQFLVVRTASVSAVTLEAIHRRD